MDSDDVFQAARVLLPGLNYLNLVGFPKLYWPMLNGWFSGADYPPLGQAFNQQFQSLPSSALEEIEFINRYRNVKISQERDCRVQ